MKMKKVYKPYRSDVTRGFLKENNLFVENGEFRKLRKGEVGMFQLEGSWAMYWDFNTDCEYKVLRKMNMLEKLIYKFFNVVL
jgi:hypothetical protein